MLNVQEKKRKKIPQNLKFHYSFNIFGRDPCQVYTLILGRTSAVLFQRRNCLKRLLPYGPMLTKTKKKKMGKIQKLQISQFFEQLW